MRVLITGAGGQLGHALMQAAWPASFRVTALDRTALDLREPDSIRAALDIHAPDLIVNAAGYTAVDRAETEPNDAFAVNAAGAGDLAIAARAAGAALIQVSTDYVFDGAKGEPYLEADAAAPINAYGVGKRAGEAAVLAAHPGAVVVRTAWLYSGGPTDFVGKVLARAARGEALTVVDDQRGSPTHVADLADALIRIGQRVTEPGAPSGLFHFAGAGGATWCDLAEAAVALWAERTGCEPPVIQPIKTRDWPTAARRPADTRLSSRKIAEVFGVEARHWRDMLVPAVEAWIEREGRA
jgi:dTDP-4-dehydrorhamnose reductase